MHMVSICGDVVIDVIRVSVYRKLAAAWHRGPFSAFPPSHWDLYHSFTRRLTDHAGHGVRHFGHDHGHEAENHKHDHHRVLQHGCVIDWWTYLSDDTNRTWKYS